MTRLQKKATQAPSAAVQATPPAPPPPAPPKLPPLPGEVLAGYRAEAEQWIQRIMAEYAITEFPEMGTKWLNRLMEATSREHAENLATKARTFAHLELLALWRQKKGRGSRKKAEIGRRDG